VNPKVKIYRSAVHRDKWVAYSEATGWVIFPAKPNGWDERKPARGLDPVYLREVPIRMALETGVVAAAQSGDPARAA